MKLTNAWNRFIYRLWSPVYDATVNRFFAPGRKRAMEVLNLKAGERVLLMGVGTGADLPLLPHGVQAVGIDLSAEMLARARTQLPLPGCQVLLIQGDAQVRPVAEASFDAAILNLILSVVPSGEACWRETLRALRPEGRVVVFDKFLPDHTTPALGRRLVNQAATRLGTDINRRLGDILAGSSCAVVHDEPSLLRGTYRVVLIRLRSGC